VVIPRLFCRDPAAELAFCTQTFGAKVLNERAGAHEDGNGRATVTVRGTVRKPRPLIFNHHHRGTDGDKRVEKCSVSRGIRTVAPPSIVAKAAQAK
jgi:hypothetical protein